VRTAPRLRHSRSMSPAGRSGAACRSSSASGSVGGRGRLGNDHKGPERVLDGGVAVEHRALGQRGLVSVGPEGLRKAPAEFAQCHLVGAENPVAGLSRMDRPSSTAASLSCPTRTSRPAIDRSIVHWVDHMPVRRQWSMRCRKWRPLAPDRRRGPRSGSRRAAETSDEGRARPLGEIDVVLFDPRCGGSARGLSRGARMSDRPDPVEASRRYTELAATYERRVRLTNRWRPGVVRHLRLRPVTTCSTLAVVQGRTFPTS
jgi:hypothetical protein